LLTIVATWRALRVRARSRFACASSYEEIHEDEGAEDDKDCQVHDHGRREVAAVIVEVEPVVEREETEEREHRGQHIGEAVGKDGLVQIDAHNGENVHDEAQQQQNAGHGRQRGEYRRHNHLQAAQEGNAAQHAERAHSAQRAEDAQEPKDLGVKRSERAHHDENEQLGHTDGHDHKVELVPGRPPVVLPEHVQFEDHFEYVHREESVIHDGEEPALLGLEGGHRLQRQQNGVAHDGQKHKTRKDSICHDGKTEPAEKRPRHHYLLLVLAQLALGHGAHRVLARLLAQHAALASSAATPSFPFFSLFFFLAPAPSRSAHRIRLDGANVLRAQSAKARERARTHCDSLAALILGRELRHGARTGGERCCTLLHLARRRPQRRRWRREGSRARGCPCTAKRF
jgi:hypothetical protein